jgi:hypothetical protein
MQESRRGFNIANNAGTVIPTGMQESRRFFPVVIHAEVGIPPGSSLHFHPSHSTTRHALLQKFRNLFLLASFQLLSNWQQNASTIYTQSPDVGELENSSNGYSTTMLVCSTSVHQHVKVAGAAGRDVVGAVLGAAGGPARGVVVRASGGAVIGAVGRAVEGAVEKSLQRNIFHLPCLPTPHTPVTTHFFEPERLMILLRAHPIAVTHTHMQTLRKASIVQAVVGLRLEHSPSSSESTAVAQNCLCISHQPEARLNPPSLLYFLVK